MLVGSGCCENILLLYIVAEGEIVRPSWAYGLGRAVNAVLRVQHRVWKRTVVLMYKCDAAKKRLVSTRCYKIWTTFDIDTLILVTHAVTLLSRIANYALGSVFDAKY